MNPLRNRIIRRFDEISLEDISLVGGKNASIGELIQSLSSYGIQVPSGFAITAEAYRIFLKINNLETRIRNLLSGLDVHEISHLREIGKSIRQLILQSKIPDEIVQKILEAYREMGFGQLGEATVSIRSSATAEDLPQASFAGQQETYLNIEGEKAILDSVLKCYASLFTDRALSYRVDQGFDHLKVAISVGVQKMVRSDLGSSGVLFTIDTESGFEDAIIINASYGLGEAIVKGLVNPDEYIVFKPKLDEGYVPIIQKIPGTKELKMIYGSDSGETTKTVPVSPEESKKFVLSQHDILQLSRWGCLIENHYSKVRGRKTPMDIEWAKDGITGELFILQARPETVHSIEKQKKNIILEEYQLEEKGKTLLTGKSVGKKISTGFARMIRDVNELHLLQEGEVLVTDKTDPDWEPAMKRASAIVTNRGGRTCHAAIVARELGVPAVVGTLAATRVLANGQMITVSAAQGGEGYVFDGKLKFKVNKMDFEIPKQRKPKLMVILGNPEEAFRVSRYPNDGVGLVRIEFMISSLIRIHPMAIARYEKITKPEVIREMDRLTAAYSDPTEYFVEKLAEGVGMIASAFYPKEVIVRLSDFKTNEYSNLIGGELFESDEENPMLGFRGASRYTHERYRDGFELECRAMKRVRERMGLHNLKLMIPFCRTVEEGQGVLHELEKNGLGRGVDGLEIYMMCEIPSNVVLAEEFSKIFDGFSIGSNDLTQLILGVDRDSEWVAPLFDEKNPAVLEMISSVIRKARKHRRKIGICGQGPSDDPEFMEFLIREKIDSISLNPDSLLKAHLQLIEFQKKNIKQTMMEP